MPFPQFDLLYGSLQCVKPEIIDVSGLSVEVLGERIEERAINIIEAEERVSATRVLW